MRLLLTGASGKLGGYVVQELESRGWGVLAPSRSQLDISRVVDLADALSALDPEVVIHAAAISSIAESLQQPDLMQRTNVESTAIIGQWCQKHRRRLIFVSSDMVFDGHRAPYAEDAVACPISSYGRSKLEAEQALKDIPEAKIVRPALMFGPPLGQHQSFFDMVLDRLTKGEKTSLFVDEWRTPLFYGDMAVALARLAELPEFETIPKVLHLGGPQRLSRLEMGLELAKAVGLEPNFAPGSLHDVTFPEPRPPDLSLVSDLIRSVLPGLELRSLASVYGA